MNGNKSFYGNSLTKKSSKLSPNKQKHQKKQQEAKVKPIIKLPSVKHHVQLEPQKNYLLEQIIGEGAFAKVYQAKRKSDGMKCVIKLVEKTKLNTEQRRKALKRELEALSLPEHPNLVCLIDKFQIEDSVGIVMEYFSNISLSQFVKKNRQLLENSLLQKITKQVCAGLMHLHSHGMSHRDIKPENILINAEYDIKIIDFGFATTQQLNEVVIAGTPQYMAPQLIARKNYDPLKADVWAFGILLYWMALGYFPQEADHKKKKVTYKKAQDLHLYFPVDINPGLQYLLRKMLNPNPKERIQLNHIMEDTWIKPKLFKAEIDRLKQSKKVYSSLISTPL